MNKYKKWIHNIIILNLTVYGLVLTLNYIIDPFEIFNSHFLNYSYQPNERFLKIDFLDKNHNKYNSYLFGSSRIGTTEPEIVEKYIPDSKFYNFTLSSANLIDNLTHLKYFLRKKYEIKNLYLQIDVDTNLISDKYLASDYLRKYHPNIKNENKIRFYYQYLTILPLKDLEGKVKINFFEDPQKNTLFDIKNNGTWHRNYLEKLIVRDPKSYIASEPTLTENKVHRTVKGIYAKENLDALKEIVELCKTNNIKLIVFTTPYNYNLLNTIDTDDYSSFLKEVSKLTEFWDFSGYNSITLDNTNYYEASHYRPKVSKLIAARIFNDKSVKIPSDFGTLVTNDNLNQHLQNLETQIKKASDLY
jgi:hypothetical protein